MDEMIIHLAGLPRRYPGALPVAHVGFHPAKRYRVRHSFRSCNFSFILGGKGSFNHQGRHIEVHAPCVLTQWPGMPCDYGPDGSWDEVYLIYQAPYEPDLRRIGFIDPVRPLWHLGRNQLAPLVLELRRACSARPLVPDRIDRIAERLVLESLLAAHPVSANRDAIARIRALIEADCLAEHDLPTLACAEGLSWPHFRRLWRRAVGCPPARFIAGLRITEACRLLASTDDPVFEVARAVGFTDPLHFSRRFRQQLGEAPSAYRQRFANDRIVR